MEVIRDDKSISKDIKEVLYKWHEDFSNNFSDLKDDPDAVFDDDFCDNIKRLRQEIEKLSPQEQSRKANISDHIINPDLSYNEVSAAIDK